MTILQKYLDIWLEYQRVSKQLDDLKEQVIVKINEDGHEVNGYVISLSKRPNFSKVSLEEARKFDAVKKVINTTKLNQFLKDGEQIHGVTYTPYVNVKHL